MNTISTKVYRLTDNLDKLPEDEKDAIKLVIHTHHNPDCPTTFQCAVNELVRVLLYKLPDENDVGRIGVRVSKKEAEIMMKELDVPAHRDFIICKKAL